MKGRVCENSQEDEEEALSGSLYQQSFTGLNFDTYSAPMLACSSEIAIPDGMTVSEGFEL